MSKDDNDIDDLQPDIEAAPSWFEQLAHYTGAVATGALSVAKFPAVLTEMFGESWLKDVSIIGVQQIDRVVEVVDETIKVSLSSAFFKSKMLLGQHSSTHFSAQKGQSSVESPQNAQKSVHRDFGHQ